MGKNPPPNYEILPQKNTKEKIIFVFFKKLVLSL